MRFEIRPPENKSFRLFVELDLVSYDRFNQKRANTPDLVSGQLPMHAIERVGGITEIVPGNQPAMAEVQGESSKMQVGSKSGSEHILCCRGHEYLQNVIFIPDGGVKKVKFTQIAKMNP
jgi:hypothetical protein